MNLGLALLAGLALGPAMLGPLDKAASMLVLPLCGGGAVTTSVPGEATPLPGTGPCCAKGCRSGRARKENGKEQERP